MALTLPVDGQTNWGDELNAAVLQSDSDALVAQTNITNHAANSPADPHGDRAYTNTQISTITSGVNLANGFVKLNSSGVIPSALITAIGGAGGIYNGIFDAVTTYGMVPGSSDSSAACQAACNAASAAGGGIVWIGPGTFSFANYVVIPTNVWILMSEGTVINRKQGSPTPSFLFTNIKFGTNNSPSTNIRITGGRLDATANNTTTACTPIFLIQSQHTIIEDVRIFTPFNNPAIELNGCATAFIKSCRFGGTQTSAGVGAPAIRLNASYTNTTPSGLLGSIYNHAVCSSIIVQGCIVDLPNTNTSATYAGLVGTDFIGLGQAGVGFHFGITVNGCLYPNSQNPGNSSATSVFSNGLWLDYSVFGNAFPETTNFADGWQSMTLQSGWTNSGSGPNAQWRFLQMGGGGSVLLAPNVNTIEIIGDVISGATSNGSLVWQMPVSGVFANSNQIVPATFTGASAPPNGARFFFTGTSPQTLTTINMSGVMNQRIFFHAFISLSA